MKDKTTVIFIGYTFLTLLLLTYLESLTNIAYLGLLALPNMVFINCLLWLEAKK